MATSSLPTNSHRTQRKSVGMQISDEGLKVTAPLRLPFEALEEALLQRGRWILTRLSAWQQSQARMLAPADLLACGLPVPLFGKPHAVVYEASLKKGFINTDTQSIHLPCAAPHNNGLDSGTTPCQNNASRALEKLLRPLALQTFQQQAERLRSRASLPHYTVHLSSAKCRWGSCNCRRELRLNWRLVFYSRAIIEYVVAHEMAHLLEMNHSARFWATVEQLAPDYLRAHQYLSDKNPEKVPLYQAAD
ncbi:MAG: M48 family metallopeptidase [Limnobacter sp.]|nr:M48 family metallopeptidase [Limnobacter sp.]